MRVPCSAADAGRAACFVAVTRREDGLVVSSRGCSEAGAVREAAGAVTVADTSGRFTVQFTLRLAGMCARLRVGYTALPCHSTPRWDLRTA